MASTFAQMGERDGALRSHRPPPPPTATALLRLPPPWTHRHRRPAVLESYPLKDPAVGDAAAAAAGLAADRGVIVLVRRHKLDVRRAKGRSAGEGAARLAPRGASY